MTLLVMTQSDSAPKDSFWRDSSRLLKSKMLALVLSSVLVASVVAGSAIRPAYSAGECGPIDLAILLDTTGSMGGAISNIKADLPGIVSQAQTASGSDLKLGYITFGQEDFVTGTVYDKSENVFVQDNLTTDLTTVQNHINLAGANGGSGDPEASDEAKNTAVNNLAALGRSGPHGQQYGDFTEPWRVTATKIAILITDAPPGGFDDSFSAGDSHQLLMHAAALDALAKGIKMSDVFVPTFGDYDGQKAILQDNAATSGGAFIETNSDGTGTSAAIKAIISTCGGPVPVGLEIKKTVILNQEGIQVDEQITSLKQAKIVEATLVEPDKKTIHVFHNVTMDVPAFIAFGDPAWEPGVKLVDGKWELKMQIVATYEDPVTRELKNVEQKIIIQFDIDHGQVSTPPGIGVVGFDKDIVISPHPAQLKGDMTIKIGENITGQTKVLVAEVSLSKPSGEVVSYTTLPVDITTGSVTIPFPGTGWVSSDGKPSLDQAGLWQMDIEIIGFYQDGTLAIKKINQKLWIDFNVIPESMIGTIALIGSSLGGFVAFRRIRAKNNGSDGKPKRSGTSLGI